MLASTLLGVYTETIISARAGTDVLLPCRCPRNPPGSPYVVWQIGDRIVDQYIPGFKKINIDPQFQGRTQSFLLEDRGNCSLLLKSVKTADEETYTCHFKNPIYDQDNVTLRVSALEEAPLKLPTSGPDSEPGKREVSCAIGGVFLVLVILLTIFLTFRYWKKCRRTTVNAAGPQDREQNHPLDPGSV